MQDMTIPKFPDLNLDDVQSDLNQEYASLESGYNNAKARRMEFAKRYRFELYGNEVNGSSKYVDSTIFNAIEWMVPTFAQPYIEGQNLINITPDGSDTKSLISAQVHKELLHYQVRKKMDFYSFLYKLSKSFFIDGESYGKHVWIKADKSKNEPVSRNAIVNVLAPQIRYDWSALSLADSYVVTEDKDITKSEIVQMRGQSGVIDSQLDKVLEGNGRNEETTNLRDEKAEHPNHVGDNDSFRTDANKLFLRREHWTNYDVDGSGIAVPVLAIFINDVLVRFIKNPMALNKHPYFKAECVGDVQGNQGIGFAELLAPIQAFKTGLFRMFSDNMNAQNNGLVEVDMNHVDDVGLMILQRAPAGTRTPIPTRKIGSIQPLPPTPIAGHSLNITELLNVEAENRTGFTRYSQGLDSSSLNQTATGISAIIQRSEMRMWELAVRFSESFLEPVVRDMIAMNQKHLTPQELQVQFGIPAFSAGGTDYAEKPAGEWISVSKDDLGGYFSVDIDLETPTQKEKKTQDMTAWAQYFGPMMPPELVQEIALISANQIGLKEIENLLRRTNKNAFGSRGVLQTAFGGGAEQGGQGPQAGPVPQAPIQPDGI